MLKRKWFVDTRGSHDIGTWFSITAHKIITTRAKKRYEEETILNKVKPAAIPAGPPQKKVV
jgi:hypothetical protein